MLKLVSDDFINMAIIKKKIFSCSNQLCLYTYIFFQVIGDIEDLLDWFHEVKKQLLHAEPLSADLDALTSLLKQQKVFFNFYI